MLNLGHYFWRRKNRTSLEVSGQEESRTHSEYAIECSLRPDNQASVGVWRELLPQSSSFVPNANAVDEMPGLRLLRVSKDLVYTLDDC